jgi:nicotinamidase-related amidase
MPTVQAEPYEFEFDLKTTALLVIDMQRDFVDPGGFGEALGNDVSLLRAAIPPTERVLETARKLGMLVIHTREGHRPDLSDLPPAKKARGRLDNGIGDPGPMGRILVRGEYGHDIVDSLQPRPGEPVVDKPGKGSFYATDLDAILKMRGITHLLVCGVTTEVCVHTTVREANDRGYECLLLGDCCAATDPGNHAAALKMVTMQNGVFGALSTSPALLEALP